MRSVIGLAKTLNLSVTGEGIETASPEENLGVRLARYEREHPDTWLPD